MENMKTVLCTMLFIYSGVASSQVDPMVLCSPDPATKARWEHVNATVRSSAQAKLYSRSEHPPACSDGCKPTGPGAPVAAGQELLILGDSRMEDPYGIDYFALCVRTPSGSTGWVGPSEIEFTPKSMDEKTQALLQPVIISFDYHMQLPGDQPACNVRSIEHGGDVADAIIKKWPKLAGRSEIALSGTIAYLDALAFADPITKKTLWSKASKMAQHINYKEVKNKELCALVLQAIVQQKPIDGREPDCNDH